MAMISQRIWQYLRLPNGLGVAELTRKKFVKSAVALSLPSKTTGLCRSYHHAGARRVRDVGGNVFAYFSQLAAANNAVNLGQGFPSFPSPAFLEKAAIEAITAGNNQYTRPGGHPVFVDVLAKMYSQLLGRQLNGMKEIVTFNGGQEGIFSILAGLVNPEEEIIILEPYFDAYKKAANLLELKTVGVPLRWDPSAEDAISSPDGKGQVYSSSGWKLDLDELEIKITDKTKLLILNTPHNPSGKVFSEQEVSGIVEIMKRHPQVVVLSDEVYEFMCYDGKKHHRIASYPDMYDRVISLFSAGKTFSCTGWRIGYCIAPEHLAKNILDAHQTMMFCSATPLELACAKAFQKGEEEDYFAWLPKMMQAKRDRLVQSLYEGGLTPISPEGGYFIMADTSGLPVPGKTSSETLRPDTALELRPDYQAATWLVKSRGVAGIPVTGFYSPQYRHLGDAFTRFAFCKDEDTLDQAHKIFSNFTNNKNV